jgi:hypothetical protein
MLGLLACYFARTFQISVLRASPQFVKLTKIVSRSLACLPDGACGLHEIKQMAGHRPATGQTTQKPRIWLDLDGHWPY